MNHRVKGCCPLDCQDTCAWEAHVEEGRVVRTVGARDHPFTRGVLCAKVNDYERRITAPDRLLHPLRRTGSKGSGAFERVSWDEALDTVARSYLSIIRESGAAALLPAHYLGSIGVMQRRALERIFHVLGASRQQGNICAASAVSLIGSGLPIGFDPEEIVHSQFIVVWGANLLTTSHHHWHFIQRAREESGARIICIDPMRTRTARHCDEHLMLRPGTDTVLAAAVAREMLARPLVERERASEVVTDLDAFAASVEPWTPERASDVCGIPADRIVEFARAFATAQPATIRMGVAPMQTSSGDALVRMLSALALLGGHHGKPGGGLFALAFPALAGASAGRPDLAPDGVRGLDLPRLGENLTNPALDPPIRGLMVWGHNPAVTQIDGGRVRAGLAREDLFTVVVEHFLTDTARYADIVLPSTTQYEHFDIVGAWGHQYITVNERAIEPRGEALSHGEIMRRLAIRLGLDHPALRETDEQIAASALPPGVGLDDLRAKGWVKAPASPAPAKRVAIGATIPLPVVPPEKGLFRLLTPKGHFFLNSTFANMPRQKASMKRPTLQIHVLDAERLGLGDGQRVALSNARGTVHAWLACSNDVSTGSVAMAGKWWDQPGESVGVNSLGSGVWTPAGQPAYNEIFVRVSAAE